MNAFMAHSHLIYNSWIQNLKIKNIFSHKSEEIVSSTSTSSIIDEDHNISLINASLVVIFFFKFQSSKFQKLFLIFSAWINNQNVHRDVCLFLICGLLRDLLITLFPMQILSQQIYFLKSSYRPQYYSIIRECA